MTNENKETNNEIENETKEYFENADQTNKGIFAEIADDVKSTYSAVKNGLSNFFQNANEKINEKGKEAYSQAKNSVKSKFSMMQKGLVIAILGFFAETLFNSFSEIIFGKDEENSEQKEQQNAAKEQFDGVAKDVISALSGDSKARDRSTQHVKEISFALGTHLLAQNASKILGRDVLGKHTAEVLNAEVKRNAAKGEAVEIAA